MKFTYSVSRIERKDCKDFILNIHYAHRWPSISYAFGLFTGKQLVGIVSYGTPPSPSLRRGIAGKKYVKNVLELNRLVLKNNIKNEASILISRSLKLLPLNSLVVSFADTSQNHVGYVYQATNFIYTGLSAKRTDWKIKGKEHLHGISVADEFRGKPHRAALLREKYGDDFYLKKRQRKHRYIYLKGGKRWKKQVLKTLKYPIKPYPKQKMVVRT